MTTMTPEEQYVARQWPKKCGCGRTYLNLDHYRLHTTYHCIYKDEFAEQEWRHCACGSTLAVATKVLDLSKE
jgi:hypothetical protein